MTPTLASVFVLLALSLLCAGQVAKVSVGDLHTCVIMTNNTLRCWGDNSRAQCGKTSAVIGNPVISVPLTDLATNISFLSLGDAFTCAIDVYGNLDCFGTNSWGEMAMAPDSSSNPIKTLALPTGGVTGQQKNIASVSGGTMYLCSVSIGECCVRPHFREMVPFLDVTCPFARPIGLHASHCRRALLGQERILPNWKWRGQCLRRARRGCHSRRFSGRL